MTIAGTKIVDIIKPEVFLPYLTERTAELSALIQSGIIVRDSNLDALASRGGIIVEMPYFADLGNDADEILSDTAALGAGKIGTKQDRARLLMRGKAWGVNDLAKALSGDDPMMAIADLVAAYWNRREQDVLLSVLKGLFLANASANAGTGSASLGTANDLLFVAADQRAAATIASTPLSASALQDSKLGPTSFIEARTILGDAASKLTAIMMHSKPYSDLQKLQLVELIPDAETKIVIPYYMGLRVIVDDGCPVLTNATSGLKEYTSYLFGEGAIGRGEGAAPVPVETYRDKFLGEDYLINRRHFIMHPRGIAWTENTCTGASPTNVEIATAANWKRVYEKKNIRIVKLVTN